MTDTLVRPTSATNKRRKRWGTAALVAASLVVAVGIVGIWSAQRDDPIADPPEIASVLHYFSVADAGDLAALNALRSEEVAANDPIRDQMLINLNNRTVVEECSSSGPAPGGGQLVTCQTTDINDFHGPAGIELPVLRTLTVAGDGTILADHAEVNFDEGSRYATQFWIWLRNSYPDVYAEIEPWDLQSMPGWRTDPADALVALDYVGEFIAQSEEYPISGE